MPHGAGCCCAGCTARRYYHCCRILHTVFNEGRELLVGCLQVCCCLSCFQLSLQRGNMLLHLPARQPAGTSVLSICCTDHAEVAYDHRQARTFNPATGVCYGRLGPRDCCSSTRQTHKYLFAHCATHCSMPLLEETSASATMASSTPGSADPARLDIRLKNKSLRTCNNRGSVC